MAYELQNEIHNIPHIFILYFKDLTALYNLIILTDLIVSK